MMKVVKEHPQYYWMGNTNTLWYGWTAFNRVCDAHRNSPTVCQRMNDCMNNNGFINGVCTCDYNFVSDNFPYTTTVRTFPLLTSSTKAANVAYGDDNFAGSRDICYTGSNNYVYLRPHWIFNYTLDTGERRICTEHDEGREGNGWIRQVVTTNDGTSLPTTFSTDWIPSFIYDPDYYPTDTNYPWDSYCPNCPKTGRVTVSLTRVLFRRRSNAMLATMTLHARPEPAPGCRNKATRSKNSAKLPA